jgi:hypothetical protein
MEASFLAGQVFSCWSVDGMLPVRRSHGRDGAAGCSGNRGEARGLLGSGGGDGGGGASSGEDGKGLVGQPARDELGSVGRESKLAHLHTQQSWVCLLRNTMAKPRSRSGGLSAVSTFSG